MSGQATIAAGYISAPERVPIEVWMQWRRDIERHASRQGLWLLRIITDDHTTTGAGLRKLVDTLRLGHVSVVIVPACEHLSPLRDGTEDLLRQLLDLHFGVRVERPVIDTPSGGRVSPRFPITSEPAIGTVSGFAACPPRVQVPVRRSYAPRVLRRARVRNT